MERMYRLCKESLWKRSELSENCFHSVVVKIILINYAKKKNLFMSGLVYVKAQNGEVGKNLLRLGEKKFVIK
jgi:hypothetical protein